VPSLYVVSMNPAFSPILMTAILISELTFSPCSVILHLVGLGLKDGSTGGVVGVWSRLPDLLTLSAYPVAGALLAACSAVTGDWTAMARAAACAGIAVAVFLVAALVASGSGGLGLGDVKLVGVLGGLLGWHSWFGALLGLATGCVIGGLMTVVLLVFRRAERTSLVAYGPALIAGSYIWAALAPIL
jgi:Flp pilus assembly protein protease CpaA